MAQRVPLAQSITPHSFKKQSTRKKVCSSLPNGQTTKSIYMGISKALKEQQKVCSNSAILLVKAESLPRFIGSFSLFLWVQIGGLRVACLFFSGGRTAVSPLSGNFPAIQIKVSLHIKTTSIFISRIRKHTPWELWPCINLAWPNEARPSTH